MIDIIIRSLFEMDAYLTIKCLMPSLRYICMYLCVFFFNSFFLCLYIQCICHLARKVEKKKGVTKRGHCPGL